MPAHPLRGAHGLLVLRSALSGGTFRIHPDFFEDLPEPGPCELGIDAGLTVFGQLLDNNLLDDEFEQDVSCLTVGIAELDGSPQVDVDTLLLVDVFDDGNVGRPPADVEVHDADGRHLSARTLDAVQLNPVLTAIFIRETLDAGIQQWQLAGHGLVQIHFQSDRRRPLRILGEREDVQGFLPLGPIGIEFGAGPARRIGSDHRADSASTGRLTARGPIRAVDVALGRLHDREDRPSQGVPPRIGRLGGRHGRRAETTTGFPLLIHPPTVRRTIEPPRQAIFGLESQHEAGQGDFFDIINLRESLMSEMRHHGPRVSMFGGIQLLVVPEETFGRTLLHQLSLMETLLILRA